MPIPITGLFEATVPGAFPLFNQIDLKGSYRSVLDNTARDAIPAAHRVEGMLVYSIGSATTYRLVGGITNGDWVVDSGGGTSLQPIQYQFWVGTLATPPVTPDGSVQNPFPTIADATTASALLPDNSVITYYLTGFDYTGDTASFAGNRVHRIVATVGAAVLPAITIDTVDTVAVILDDVQCASVTITGLGVVDFICRGKVQVGDVLVPDATGRLYFNHVTIGNLAAPTCSYEHWFGALIGPSVSVQTILKIVCVQQGADDPIATFSFTVSNCQPKATNGFFECNWAAGGGTTFTDTTTDTFPADDFSAKSFFGPALGTLGGTTAYVPLETPPQPVAYTFWVGTPVVGAIALPPFTPNGSQEAPFPTLHLAAAAAALLPSFSSVTYMISAQDYSGEGAISFGGDMFHQLIGLSGEVIVNSIHIASGDSGSFIGLTDIIGNSVVGTGDSSINLYLFSESGQAGFSSINMSAVAGTVALRSQNCDVNGINAPTAVLTMFGGNLTGTIAIDVVFTMVDVGCTFDMTVTTADNVGFGFVNCTFGHVSGASSFTGPADSFVADNFSASQFFNTGGSLVGGANWVPSEQQDISKTATFSFGLIGPGTSFTATSTVNGVKPSLPVAVSPKANLPDFIVMQSSFCDSGNTVSIQVFNCHTVSIVNVGDLDFDCFQHLPIGF